MATERDWSKSNIFDPWREFYDELTWQDQLEFYDEVARRWPKQTNYPFGWFKSCFSYIGDRLGKFSVLEIGGWTGEMACQALETFSSITSWTNYEVCRWAANTPACDNERYSAVIAEDFPWNVKLPECDVFVSSHTLEHIKAAEAERLFLNLPASVKFMAHAVSNGIAANKDWCGYGGSHILECDWDGIEALAEKAGFARVKGSEGFSSRMYVRE